MGYPSADYAGIYAVENDEILSAVRVLRLPYTSPEGVHQIAGIQGVVTRRDNGRKGLARRLLLEVHEREKAAGSAYSLLWTSRGQVAHSLYESLGYRDVYTPELAALQKGNGRSQTSRYTLNGMEKDGTRTLEELHRRSTERRLGFTPRPPGIVSSLIHLGFLPGDLHTIRRDGELVGYALLQKRSTWCSLDEFVLSTETPLEDVLPILETAAQGGWFVIRNTSVRDALPLLRKRGYHFSGFAYYSLLALSLQGHRGGVAAETGTESPRFTCQQLDYF